MKDSCKHLLKYFTHLEMGTYIIYLIPFLALILATLLLYNGLTRINKKPAPGGENGTGRNPSSQSTGWMAFASLILSGLLYGSSFYNLYWQFVWDSTTDSGEIFLLYGPFIAVLVSGILLSGTLRGRVKWFGFLYTVLLAAQVRAISIRRGHGPDSSSFM